MPPIGDLRFTFPQKIAPDGQKYYVGNNASNPYTDSICSQMDFHEVVTGQEDCLHLHVYVPETGKGQYNFYTLLGRGRIGGGGYFYPLVLFSRIFMRLLLDKKITYTCMSVFRKQEKVSKNLTFIW